MRSLKSECLNRMIFFGENSLRDAVRQFLAHYHEERNHQGLGNRLIEPDFRVDENTGDIQCRERIGGLLKYYYRDAASDRFVRKPDSNIHPLSASREWADRSRDLPRSGPDSIAFIATFAAIKAGIPARPRQDCPGRAPQIEK